MARILFPLPANNAPSGGRKFIYHVVDFLNEAGIESWVVHPTPGFRLDWFENRTQAGYCRELFPNLLKQKRLQKLRRLLRTTGMPRRAKDVPELTLRQADVLVVPETRLGVVNLLPRVNTKIVLNQNPFFTFSQQLPSATGPVSFFEEANVIGTVVVSKLNRQFQEFAFPETRIVSAQLFVENTFGYGGEKKIQFAYMPRRNCRDAVGIMNMVKNRSVVRDAAFVAIDGRTQSEVVKILGESLVFLSFAEREGFGLPGAEAMACGCIVIGYTGFGGEEYFDPEYCFPIREGDLCGYVQTMEDVVKRYQVDPSSLDTMRRKASETICRRYSREKSKKSIVAAFSELLPELVN